MPPGHQRQRLTRIRHRPTDFLPDTRASSHTVVVPQISTAIVDKPSSPLMLCARERTVSPPAFHTRPSHGRFVSYADSPCRCAGAGQRLPVVGPHVFLLWAVHSTQVIEPTVT